MKIYARTYDNIDLLRKYEGTDLWVYGKINNSIRAYINISYVDDDNAFIYAISIFYISNPKIRACREELVYHLYSYLEDRKNNKERHARWYNIDEITLYPEKGIYTTEELTDLLEE